MQARAKLVFGVGVNDADYHVSPKINGKQVRCKIYSTWVDMLRRCYDGLYLNKYPSYIDCTVCQEWLIFSGFRLWMEKQDYIGKHLDKDILIHGNKIYSPTTCLFVSSRVNLLLTDSFSSRGALKVGVCMVRSGYQAKVHNNDIHEYIGTFKTEVLASNAYIKRKAEIIRAVSCEQIDERLSIGLNNYANKLEEGIC